MLQAPATPLIAELVVCVSGSSTLPVRQEPPMIPCEALKLTAVPSGAGLPK